MKPGALAAVTAASAVALAGCATPKVLKQPVAAPTMTRTSETNPLPAHATPYADPHP
jgi:hypothetical protein